MKFVIRRAKTDREFEQIYALDLLIFGIEDGSLGSIDDLVGSEWWIVWDENMEPVGYCGIVIYSDFAVHKRSGVLPRVRGHGLQKKMLALREAFARKQGCNLICTYVSVQNTHSANNLIAQGYRVYNPEWRWGGDNFLYIQKHLTQSSRKIQSKI